jgi:peptidoglycan/LPS O-acetylase OafA/YrhL
MTGAEGLRRNNIDALRVTAALMVIHGHGWVLSTGDGPGLWGVPFARVGLDIFFSISGYLVTGSWERTPRLWQYLAKRALRIFPGLIACVVVTVVAVGLLASSWPLQHYFAAAATWRYLLNIVLLQELFLPGAFTSLRELGTVNGSLWSLLPEFICYLTVPLFALLPSSTRLAVLAGSGMLLGAVGLYLFEGYDGPPLVLYHLDLKYALVEVPFFFAGSLLRLLEGRIDGLYRADLCLALLAGNYALSTWTGWGNIPFEWLTLPYMVICFGRMSLPVFNQAARFGDLSYGLYLYAFPIQQLVVARLPGIQFPVLACVAFTLPVAFLSWHLIEAPALRAKSPRPVRVRPSPAV